MRRFGRVSAIGLAAMVVVGAAFASGFASAQSPTALSGALWGWGRNYDGKLGFFSPFGSGDVQSVPALVRPAGITEVSEGNNHVLALKADGSAIAWGSGPLGDGNSTGSLLVPVDVVSPVRFSALATGTSSSFGLGADGSVWAWGRGTSDVGYVGIDNPLIGAYWEHGNVDAAEAEFVQFASTYYFRYPGARIQPVMDLFRAWLDETRYPPKRL